MTVYFTTKCDGLLLQSVTVYFTTKCDVLLLQSVTAYFTTKCDGLLLQSVTAYLTTKCDDLLSQSAKAYFITNCDGLSLQNGDSLSYHKMRWTIILPIALAYVNTKLHCSVIRYMQFILLQTRVCYYKFSDGLFSCKKRWSVITKRDTLFYYKRRCSVITKCGILLNYELQVMLDEFSENIRSYTLCFFYKNLFYKNVEAEINQNFKNVLRTFLRLSAIKNVFILLICL